MTKYIVDLAVELSKTYGLKAEDIECKGGICYDKNDGKILMGNYIPLVGLTNEEIYKYEVNSK